MDHPAFRDVVRSCVAAGVVHVIHHPLYTLKSQMMYYGPEFSFKKFLRNSRNDLRFLYRGLVPRTIGVMPEKAVKLGMVNAVGHWIDRHVIVRGPADQLETSNYLLFLARWGLSGIAGGAVTTMVGCPTDRAMVLAQIRKQGFLTVIRQTGLQGLYLGWTATLYRDMSFNCVFFTTRELGIRLWQERHDGEKPVLWKKHAIGMFAGMVAATISCPFDVIKTRMQGRELTDPYRSCSNIFFAIVRDEGPKFLFKGLLPRLYVVPSAMAALVIIYEQLAHFI